jgi:transposase
MKLFLGADVSKGYCDFAFLNGDNDLQMDIFQLDDTKTGHEQLNEIIKGLFEKYKGLELFCAVESTGGYEKNWYNSLKMLKDKYKLKVALINPAGVSYNSRAKLKRNTTDAVSAQNIAEYLISHPDKVNYNQYDDNKSLRSHWNFAKMLKKQRTQTINQLETILYCANPTLLNYKKDYFPNWLIELLIMCPTSQILAKTKPDKIAKIPYITLKKASVLIGQAKNATATQTDEGTALLISQMVQHLKMIEQNIDLQMKLIEEKFINPDIEILTSFPGISTNTAIGLMLEIGDVTRFETSKDIACFFGVNPKFKDSGDKKSKVRMSKQGSSNMRAILFLIALTAIVHNPIIRAIYKKKTSQGMKRKAAIGVCMHKILRIVYGMLKHKQAFDLKVDLLNQERSTEKQKEKKTVVRQTIENSRRFHPFDNQAPISRRQNKKREEYEMSQSENNVTINGINHTPKDKFNEKLMT